MASVIQRLKSAAIQTRALVVTISVDYLDIVRDLIGTNRISTFVHPLILPIELLFHELTTVVVEEHESIAVCKEERLDGDFCTGLQLLRLGCDQVQKMIFLWLCGRANGWQSPN